MVKGWNSVAYIVCTMIMPLIMWSQKRSGMGVVLVAVAQTVGMALLRMKVLVR